MSDREEPKSFAAGSPRHIPESVHIYRMFIRALQPLGQTRLNRSNCPR